MDCLLHEEGVLRAGASGIRQNSKGSGSWRRPLIVMRIWGFRSTIRTGTCHELQRRDRHGKYWSPTNKMTMVMIKFALMKRALNTQLG